MNLRSHCVRSTFCIVTFIFVTSILLAQCANARSVVQSNAVLQLDTFSLDVAVLVVEDDDIVQDDHFLRCDGFDEIFRVTRNSLMGTFDTSRVSSWESCLTTPRCSNETLVVLCSLIVGENRGAVFEAYKLADGSLISATGGNYLSLYVSKPNKRTRVLKIAGNGREKDAWTAVMTFCFEIFGPGYEVRYCMIRAMNMYANHADLRATRVLGTAKTFDEICERYETYMSILIQIRELQGAIFDMRRKTTMTTVETEDETLYRALRASALRKRKQMRETLQSLALSTDVFAVFRRWRRRVEKREAGRRFGLLADSRLARSQLGTEFVPFDIFTHAPEDCRFISKEIVLGGFWEPIKTNRILHLMKEAAIARENALFVDVGANIGWFTLACAAQGHHVIAVEPSAYNMKLLNASLAQNRLEGLVQQWEVAMTETTEAASALSPENRACLHTTTHNNRGNFILSTNASQCDKFQDVESIRLATLDDIVPIDADIHVLKLDIEGTFTHTRTHTHTHTRTHTRVHGYIHMYTYLRFVTIYIANDIRIRTESAPRRAASFDRCEAPLLRDS